jgi:putative restriction endonuclease
MINTTSMTSDTIREQFSRLGVWKRAGVRAPYKPLLLLYALARYRSGGARLIPFSEIESTLPSLFRAFGPVRRSYNANYPFWYLRTDGVWEVEPEDRLESRKGKSNEPTTRALLEADAKGGLTPELYYALTDDPKLLQDVASDLLEAHFPETLHAEILSAVGLEFAITRAVRSALFRQHVLVAYEYRCAICSFDARLGDSLLGIEAAHIKWHQAGGPGSVENGIAMCSLHHSLFDRGAFTLTEDRRLEVSQQVNGGPMTVAQLIEFHAAPLRLPSNPAHGPAIGFVDWHRREVFKGPGRWLSPAA